MGATNRAAAARSAAAGAWSNPYVRRVVEDPELRENVRAAFENARSAYSRLSNGKAATKVLLDDKKFQKDLKDAADALRDAGMALREGPKKKKKRRGGFGRLLVIAIIGAGLALAFSSDLRNKVLDLLFGAEEEFDYTSTTAPPAPPPPADTTPASDAPPTSTPTG